jgi:hypothetical protein
MRANARTRYATNILTWPTNIPPTIHRSPSEKRLRADLIKAPTYQSAVFLVAYNIRLTLHRSFCDCSPHRRILAASIGCTPYTEHVNMLRISSVRQLPCIGTSTQYNQHYSTGDIDG